jgi:hypothetical protein
LFPAAGSPKIVGYVWITLVLLLLLLLLFKNMFGLFF